METALDDSEDRIERILAEADALLERVREEKVRINQMMEDNGIDRSRLDALKQQFDPADLEEVARLAREEQQRSEDELERLLASAGAEPGTQRPLRRHRQMV